MRFVRGATILIALATPAVGIAQHQLLASRTIHKWSKVRGTQSICPTIGDCWNIQGEWDTITSSRTVAVIGRSPATPSQVFEACLRTTFPSDKDGGDDKGATVRFKECLRQAQALAGEPVLLFEIPK